MIYRKIVFFLFLAFCTIASKAQIPSYYVYCQVSSVTINGGYAKSAIVMYADSAYTIKDQKDRPKTFKTFLSILNYMGRQGWKIEPITLSDSSNEDVVLMSKLVSSEEDALAGIKKRKHNP